MALHRIGEIGDEARLAVIVVRRERPGRDEKANPPWTTHRAAAIRPGPTLFI
jgi:hypothetical protein